MRSSLCGRPEQLLPFFGRTAASIRRKPQTPRRVAFRPHWDPKRIRAKRSERASPRRSRNRAGSVLPNDSESYRVHGKRTADNPSYRFPDGPRYESPLISRSARLPQAPAIRQIFLSSCITRPATCPGAGHPAEAPRRRYVPASRSGRERLHTRPLADSTCGAAPEKKELPTRLQRASNARTSVP